MEGNNEIEELNTQEESAGSKEHISQGDVSTDEQNEEDYSTKNAFDITGKFKQPSKQEQTQPRRKQFIGVNDKRMETKRIMIFLAICFGMAWFMEIFSIIPLYKSSDVESVKEAVDMISQIMLAPALAAIAARLFTREGLVKSGFQFNFSEHKFLFLFGWFGTTALTFIGAILYFIIFRENFDPNMEDFVASYTLRNAQNSGAPITPVEIVASFKADLLVKIFTAAVLDIMNSFGEEWGFRAYLLPKLFRKIGAIPAMIVSGLVSGLWYAPLVYLGYYYGDSNIGFPIVNIIAMCIFSMVMGVIYSFLSLRTGSIFPAVFAHSAVNVMMSQAALMTFDGGNYFIGPAPTGIISGLPFIIVAIICLVYMHKNPIKVQTEQE